VFENGSDAVTTADERVLEKEWPALRAELSVTARAWRVKGLELIGVPPAAIVALELPEAEAPRPASRRPASTCLPGRSFRAKAGPRNQKRRHQPVRRSPAVRTRITGQRITLCCFCKPAAGKKVGELCEALVSGRQ
jgi:hypothetical protein